MSCFTPIAVIGQACVVPGALTPERLWNLVVEGRVAHSPIPADRLRADPRRLTLTEAQRNGGADGMIADRYGLVSGFDAVFDPQGFAVDAAMLAGLDPLNFWLLHCGREALREAGLAAGDPGLRRAGAVIGNLLFPTQGMAALAESSVLERAGWPALPAIDWRNRFSSGQPVHLLCRALGLGAGGYALDAACAASLYAVKLGIDWLADGRADLMIAGGVNGADPLTVNMGFTALHAQSPTGQSRPFHAAANGLVAAEGAALVVMKRLADAVRDGDRILGVIRGIGLSNDGRDGGPLAPSEAGQVRALRAAYACAGMAPESVSYLECHATGTVLGDAAELRAASAVFGAERPLTIGSLKANIGHLTTAAGAAALVKLLMALRNATLPPTPNARPLTPALAGSGFEVLDRPRPWVADGPRRAGLSTFGFGGNNAHLVLEEWEPANTSQAATVAAPIATVPHPVAVVALAMRCGPMQTDAATRAFLSEVGPAEARADTIHLPVARLRTPPSDLSRTLPQQLLFAEVASAAIGQTSALPHARTGVVVGAGCDPEIARLVLRARFPELAPAAGLDAGRGRLLAADVIGTLGNMVANRLSASEDLQGPGFTVAAEEQSGIRALEIAARALLAGEIDAAIVGAVDLCVEPVHETAARVVLSPGCHRPGDVACALVLRREEDALRAGLPILATIVAGEADTQEGTADWTPFQDRHRFIFGHAHAADGLLQLACAVAAVRDGVLPAHDEARAVPWTARGRRRALLRIRAHEAPPISVTVAEGTAAPRPLLTDRPQVLAYGGADFAALDAALAQDRPTDPAHLPPGPRAVLATLLPRTEALTAARRAVGARIAGRGPVPLPPGIAILPGPVEGELAFVFTGAASAYRGMGQDLLLALPTVRGGIDTSLGAPFVGVDPTGATEGPDSFAMLVGASFLAQAHANLSRALGLRPTAAIGLSSGESNALVALGAWDDMAGLLRDVRECGLYTERLGGRQADVRQWWETQGIAGEHWEAWTLRADPAAVRQALHDESAVHLLIVNSPQEVVIGGDAAACTRVITRLERSHARPLGLDLAVHCPPVSACGGLWRRIHCRPTHDLPAARVYLNAWGEARPLTQEGVADALLAQAVDTVDFARTINRAWEDGVRLFVEHGPRNQCARWIGEILGDRPFLALSYDHPGRSAAAQAWHVVAHLLAAGVLVDLRILTLAPETPATGLEYDAHWPSVRVALPPLPDAGMFVLPTPCTMALRHGGGTVPVLMAAPCDVVPGRVRTLERGGLGVQAAADAARGTPPALPGPAPSVRPASPMRLDRRDLERHATGRISELFGPLFAVQDSYRRQVRMPAPPLLLADRVTDMTGTPGSMGIGTVWTETDIPADAWFLHAGRMPSGLAVEAGQADLLLISWLGADFENRGERVYRLLGCELILYGAPPRVGDVLCYEIHIDGHVQAGATRLFRFHSDLRIDGALRLSIRHGQAGFFTDAEMDASEGVLWSPDTGAHLPADLARLDPPPCVTHRRSFSESEIAAFAVGDALTCFGPGFEWTATHTRTPGIPDGRMRLLRSVPEFDPHGGPWGRGYLRAEWRISPDDWFFAGHFKNDPCMPGTLMVDGCGQAMAVCMAALGLTLKRDGWRFQPATDRPYKLRCRGQVGPNSELLTYEVFVEELVAGPVPMLVADVLCCVDGLKAMHCRGLALQLVPDWPLEALKPTLDFPAETRAAAKLGALRLDGRAMLACTIGRPFDAFGPAALKHDNGRRTPRLPGKPYLCISRIARLDAEQLEPRIGASVEAEFDIVPDDWYFDASGSTGMPFCILMEATLQPCGWLASLCGFDQADEELFFRNLDGTATVYAVPQPGDGVLITRAELVSASRLAGMVILGFAVQCRIGERLVLEMRTSFGFFPGAALAAQVGLPAKEQDASWIALPEENGFDVSVLPLALFGGSCRIARPPLLMLDRVSGWWRTGGTVGLGLIRAEKDVDPREWFFRAHFFQDPVQPGSLGVEAMLQALQIHMLKAGLIDGLDAARFEPVAAGREMVWKYRGQVLPTDCRVTVLVEVTAQDISAESVLCTARGSLWVDGLRIYEVPTFGMRVVGTPRSAPMQAFDLATTPWFADHCPTYAVPTVPMAWIAELLASCAVAAWPGETLVGLRGVVLTRWFVLGGPPIAYRCETRERLGDAVEVVLLLADGKVGARGTAVLGSYGVPPAPLEVHGLGPPADGKWLYGDLGMMFHGPALQFIESLRSGTNGAVAILAPTAGGPPQGCIDPGLLDGLAQIPQPHDARAAAWSGMTEGQFIFPCEIEALYLFGPPLPPGRVESRIRLIGPSERGSAFHRFVAQALVDDVVRMQVHFVFVQFRAGATAGFTPLQRKRFLRDRQAVAGLGLGQFSNGCTRVTPGDVAAVDWMPGTLAAAYNCPGLRGLALLKQVAAQQHVASMTGLHPAEIAVSTDRRSASCARLPWNRFRLAVHLVEGAVEVSDTCPPSIDVPVLRDALAAVEAPTAASEIGLALIARFVRFWTLPRAAARLAGRPLLFLSNHQTYLEGVNFCALTTAGLGVPVHAVLKQEHRDRWIGHFDRFARLASDSNRPETLHYVDRSSPASIRDTLAGFAAGTTPRSLLIFAEGTRMRQAGEQLRSVSSAVIDLAIQKGMAIVPVRISGGLPREPGGGKLDLPFGYGRQDYMLGEPIEPDELARLPLPERRRSVVAAINALPPATEVPLPGDCGFIARVEARLSHMEAKPDAPLRAALVEIILEMTTQTPRIASLQAVLQGDAATSDAWIAEARNWLTGAARW